MVNEKYILSDTCKILKPGTLKSNKTTYTKQLSALENGEAFILERKGNWYLINPTIKSFLECFEGPVNVSTVIEKLAIHADCDARQIEIPVSRFLKQMLKQKIIIQESKRHDQNMLPPNSNQKIEQDAVIGNYKFENRIFTNNKIEIYKATSLSGNHPVAIKILKQAIPKKESIQSFAQEFFLLDELGAHPHICRFIELVQTDDLSFGVLEFVDGLPGRKFIRSIQLNLETRLSLLSQFFEAMAFIHRNGFLHGDLHLSNLLIDENHHLKIIDFNMSNRAKPHKNEIVREGGVHQYIAPEKLNSRVFKIVKGPASFESEVYQMGVIAYFFLYEKMPFEGFTWKDLARNILSSTAVFAEKTPSGETIPQQLIAFVEKALHKNPVQRFPSANILKEKWIKLLKAI